MKRRKVKRTVIEFFMFISNFFVFPVGTFIYVLFNGYPSMISTVALLVGYVLAMGYGIKEISD